MMLTCMVMCADPDLQTAHEVPNVADSNEANTSIEVRYRLDWDWGQAEAHGEGWRVNNDRDFEVHVHEGYLTSYSLQLAPCTPDDLSQKRLIPHFVGVRKAFAGHGDVDDPSAWLTGIAEQLATPVESELTPVSLSKGLYCRAHYLIAKAETKAENLPEAFNMVGTSLYIQGEAIDSGGAVYPFTVWSTLPIGQLMSWTEPVSVIDLSEGSVELTLTRDLGRFFDGVNFETMTSEAIEKTILLGLAERSRVTLTQTP